MLIAAPEISSQSAEIFDVIIIGAGVVGIFCAAELERRGLHVALIEGGGLTPDTYANAKFTELAGRTHSSVETGRAAGLGGTGLLWGGQLSEMSAVDLESGKGFWPISYADLCSLYNRVYATVGLPARLNNAAARARFGGDEGVVDDVERIFSFWLPNPNLAHIFRSSLIGSPRLRVFTQCKAVGFEFDDVGRAVRVVMKTPIGLAQASARQFVVAAGVVESVRFFLAAQRDEKCPWRENRRIGLSFQDHIGGELGSLVMRNERLFRDCFETAFSQGFKYMPKLRYSGAVPGTRLKLSVSAFPSFRSDLGEHISNLKLFLKATRTGTRYQKWYALPKSAIKIGRTFFPLVMRYVRERRVLAIMDKGVALSFQCEQLPRVESRIGLKEGSLASDGLPVAVLDWQAGPEEAAFIATAAERFSAYFEKSGSAHLNLDPDLVTDPPMFMARQRDTSHPAGGLCMSARPAEGATDAEGRIWGATNVYAAGAATLATSGEANITLTALALALRLVDRLAAGLASPLAA